MCDPAVYICTDYGYTTGTTIENLEILGKRDDNHDGSPVDDPIRTIRFSDYHQDKSTKALVVLVAAEWCAPCRIEQPGLIDLYNKYDAASAGVAFLEALAQDKFGNPADMLVADRWANTQWGAQQQKIPFDIAADSASVLGPYYNVGAYPMQMVIRTSDMKIMYQNNGNANEQLGLAIDDAIGK